MSSYILRSTQFYFAVRLRNVISAPALAFTGHIRSDITASVKVKFSLEQSTKALRGSRDISLLFLQPRRYMGVGGLRHAPAALPPGKDTVPIV